MRGLLIVVATLTSACATAVDVRDNAGVVREFRLPLAYQQAYRNFRDHAKQCYVASGFLGGGMVGAVDADMYDDLKRGEVLLYSVGPLGPQHMARFEFVSVSPTESKMIVKLAIDPIIKWRDLPAHYKQFAERADIPCELA